MDFDWGENSEDNQGSVCAQGFWKEAAWAERRVAFPAPAKDAEINMQLRFSDKWILLGHRGEARH